MAKLIAFLLMTVCCCAHARTTVPLEDGWRVLLAGDVQWQAVRLPHSFYVAGGAQAIYERALELPPPRAGQHYFLEFDGAMLVTDLWVNGHVAGHHAGGFARFRFDVTPWLKTGHNQLRVKVDNARHDEVPPLGGDYTMFGGLYRPVRLVTTGDLHVDMLDYGGPGVTFTADGVSHERAALAWTVRVTNERAHATRAVVTCRLRDADRRVVAEGRADMLLPPHSLTPVRLDSTLPLPHLWQGVADPYLYTSETELHADSAIQDQVSLATGIRSLQLDAQRGLLLNGAPYRAYGVNVHQTTLPGKATAVSDADIDADFGILRDLGVTALRFAHYQHPQRAYDMADRLGWLVWTEAPLTSEVRGSAAFQANSEQQLRELIRQNSHHPSVMVWGLGNEIYKVDADSARTLDALQAAAHAENPSRPTTYANCCGEIDGPQASHTDAVGSNVYFGWYDGAFADLGRFLDRNHAKRPTAPQAVSEYGAGASVLQQEDPPRRPQPAGRWHPEQYQALYNEAAWRQIAARPWLWASFVWVGFDFPSAGRNEGDTPGFNDKGLVSFDRSVKKDAYYWYQANWSQRPMVHITSRRFSKRARGEVEVKVYSNQPAVHLRLNGADLGTQSVVDHIAAWQVQLAPGANHLAVAAGEANDTADWTFEPK